jgi:hypothetical protein
MNLQVITDSTAYLPECTANELGNLDCYPQGISRSRSGPECVSAGFAYSPTQNPGFNLLAGSSGQCLFCLSHGGPRCPDMGSTV